MELLELALTICCIPLLLGVSVLMYYLIRDIRSGKR